MPDVKPAKADSNVKPAGNQTQRIATGDDDDDDVNWVNLLNILKNVLIMWRSAFIKY